MKTKHVPHFTDASFKTEVLESGQPVLVDFWAPWCAPCNALAPTIEALSERYEGQVTVGKLNVDENSETAAEYGIRSIPAVLLFDKGEVVERFVGIQPRERYDAALHAELPQGPAHE